MLNNRLRVPLLPRHLSALLVLVRIMHCLALHILEFRYPLSNKLAVRIETLRLKPRIEYAEIGLWVYAGTGGETPPAVVGREVAVY